MKRIPVIHLARVLRVLILAVLAVRWLTRDRLSSVNRYALWLVVLIRLLIPIQLPFLSSLGAVDLAPQMENTPVYAFHIIILFQKQQFCSSNKATITICCHAGNNIKSQHGTAKSALQNFSIRKFLYYNKYPTYSNCHY